jgi:prolyl-tRNA synthetase
MGSYGIGISRLVAAIIEVSHDERGIIWPIQVAPFKASIINLNIKDDKCNEISNNLYNQFVNENIDVLYDDTSDSAGAKFAVHDLIGSPWQIIVGPKKAGSDLVELKHRESGEIQDVSVDTAVIEVISNLHVK